jgi:hypothetical protein
MNKLVGKFLYRIMNQKVVQPKIPNTEPAENTLDIYSADSPKTNPELDEFNRREFSKRIAQTLSSRQETSSLVVGIYGKWGEGKTTVMNFVASEIKQHDNVITIFFNPWMFPSEAELFVAFYNELAKGLKKSLPTAWEKVGQGMKEYIAPILGLVDKADFAVKIGNLLTNVQLTELRDRIGKFLVEQKKLVVVFMDDIDRLDKDEIHAIFRLIKLSANFENIIYVLAFDPEIVEDALSERYFTKKEIAGQNFLEKIVQVPINLPKIPVNDLRDFCYKQIDNALNLSGIHISESDAQEFTRGFIIGIEIRLNTPRMALRYANMLNFSLPLVTGEVHIAEFLLIEAIRAFYPNTYEIIKDNREAFTAVRLGGLSTQPAEKEEINRIVEKAFDGLTTDESSNIRRLITILFPRQNNSIYGSEWDKKWSEQKRIASDKYFDRYFTYSIPSGDVSDIQIDNLINAIDGIYPSELIKTLEAMLTIQNAEVFISKLLQKIGNIPTAGKAKLARSISLLGTRLPNPNTPFSSHSPFSRGALLVTYLVEAQENEEEKLYLGIEVVNVAEPITFAVEFVRWLRMKDSDHSVISAVSLQMITSSLANRIEKLVSQGIDFFNEYSDKAPNLFWFWGKYGIKENADKYLSTYFTSNIQNVEKLIESVIPIEYPLDGSPPHKSEFERNQYDYLQSFIDPELLYGLLKSKYKDELESDQYPSTYGKTSDLQNAKQFAWVHKFVLKEKLNSSNSKTKIDNLSPDSNLQ